MAPESALEGCEPAESSSSPSLWTAAQMQPQEAGIMRGAPDAVAQWGGERGGFRPWPVGAGDVFSAILACPGCWCTLERRRTRAKVKGQRPRSKGILYRASRNTAAITLQEDGYEVGPRCGSCPRFSLGKGHLLQLPRPTWGGASSCAVGVWNAEMGTSRASF